MLAIKTISLKPTIFKREMLLMGTRFEFSIVGDNPHWADERVNEAIAEINRVEKLISVFNDESAVNDINRHAGVKPVKTNGEIFRLISRSLQISELTHGSFDLTYYTVTKEEADKNKSENKAKQAGKNAIPGNINFKNVIIDPVLQTVFLKEKNMRISFGSNSKGYAADRAKYILQMNGVSSGVINAGGDLIAWGLQPDNEPWTVAAADSDQSNLAVSKLEIGNMAIATSVNNIAQTTILSKSNSNTFNSKAGFPVSGIKSVSIISTSAELSDSLSAAIMLMGINAGLYLINQLNQIACVIIDDQNRVYTSKDVNISN